MSTTYTLNVRLHQTHPDKRYNIRMKSSDGGYDQSSSGNEASFSGVPAGSGTVYATRDDHGGVDKDYSAYTDYQTVDVYMGDA